MNFDLTLQQYVDWEVKNVIPIKGKYGYRVILKYMDGSERSQQKAGFLTEKDANVARDITLGELYAGKYVVYANVRVKEFMEFWVEEDIKHRVNSNETYDTYRNIVYNHVIPALGSRKMVGINRGDIQKFYNERAEYSVSVARLVKTVMNVSMRYAVEKKVMADNPAIGINLPKKVAKKQYHTRNIDTQKTLNMEQILVLLEASRNTPIHMQVLFNVLMGLRRREINGVKYSDIDYINRTLKVQRQLGKVIDTKKEDFAPNTFTKQEVQLKTPSSYRDLPIPDYVFEAILEQRKIYERNRSRRTTVFQDSGYICCSTTGKPRSKDFHWTHYKKLLQENHLPDIRWHDLRSTFCTILLKNDFNPKAVSKLMGHAKELITMDVYGDNRGIIADCVDELQPFIDEVLPDPDEEMELATENIDVMISAEDYLI
ncbi:tyrosine-type recombinase/integrase [Eisenbergiella porci]|uniref:tyrosine-type recombinase/integrase n=1 Tax=Eisenbergiella porci TaxID=2652274 RepID=UPI0022E274AE|nr:tyrosine-type recombinase/integrase [Eisenbergiella porci]